MKNKAQKNGYKHTLQKRFLTLLLVSIILASGMIGGARDRQCAAGHQ